MLFQPSLAWATNPSLFFLGWFQTSLPLAALPLRRVITACHFKVAALSGHIVLAFSPIGIGFKLNRSQLSAVATVGKAARLLIDWLDAAYRLVFPLRQVALSQLYKYHHQSSNAASGKLVLKQH